MIYFVKQSEIRNAIKNYLKTEGKDSNVTYEELVTTYPIGSDALLPYIIFNYAKIHEIDENKNIEEQLKQFKISFKEFAMYLVFYKLDYNSKNDYNLTYTIAETIVSVNNNLKI